MTLGRTSIPSAGVHGESEIRLLYELDYGDLFVASSSGHFCAQSLATLKTKSELRIFEDFSIAIRNKEQRYLYWEGGDEAMKKLKQIQPKVYWMALAFCLATAGMTALAGYYQLCTYKDDHGICSNLDELRFVKWNGSGQSLGIGWVFFLSIKWIRWLLAKVFHNKELRRGFSYAQMSIRMRLKLEWFRVALKNEIGCIGNLQRI